MAAAFLFLGTAFLVAFCVPGVILPMAIVAGTLFGTWRGVALIGLGTLVGSQILFIVARHSARDRLRAWIGKRLSGFERRFEAYGIWYVIGLRLIGAPHFLVTAGSALMPIASWSFAAASLLGVLPAIAIAAATGAAI
jgi:uncharacterized membrane protein YdjX (TVP38/TMEM64 family)